uniref:Uncharacterized protein n=1 Tax=Oryza rufipogon TaxID=4529 RepID=A0A0E0NM59_ORYRU
MKWTVDRRGGGGGSVVRGSKVCGRPGRGGGCERGARRLRGVACPAALPPHGRPLRPSDESGYPCSAPSTSYDAPHYSADKPSVSAPSTSSRPTPPPTSNGEAWCRREMAWPGLSGRAAGKLSRCLLRLGGRRGAARWGKEAGQRGRRR